MITEVNIADARKRGIELFNVKATKLSGHLFVEIIKDALLKEGFQVSNRDVFIKNFKSEIDLLIVKKNAKAYYNLIYSPEDVLFALELKVNGSYGESTITNLKNIFDNIKQNNPNINCVYLTFTERITYKYKVTEGNIGYKVVELFPRKKDNPNEEDFLIQNGNWQKFIDYLNSYHH
ncbi:MAG: hypothetical protein JXA54_00320 [Candidatus Heimdallarchaeota archaeon]|nr:hypothetical protein [Candidatus Heimdallarchaeota archaeon]